MKILLVNKFLFPNGGSETYMFKLGEYLTALGNEIQYFGMEDEKNIVGNTMNSNTSNMDLRGKGKRTKLTNPFKVIYSIEARKKIKTLLLEWKPDIVHLNNINFQITPSIVYEIKKQGIPIVWTVHDPQIACPNHRLYIEATGGLCDKCVTGSYFNCLKLKCMQGSVMKSLLAMLESYYYHKRNTYNLVDRYICPSKFIAKKIHQGGVSKNRIMVMHNFSDVIQVMPDKREDNKPYVLYFGRLSEEKGIKTLITVCKQLPQIKFVFAGTGPLAECLNGIANIEYVGFKKEKELQRLIYNAAFTVYPSEWYENCPLSVLESQALGTPVIGSDLGGTKELIEQEKTGLIVKGRDADALKSAIERLWNDHPLRMKMSKKCLEKKNNTIDIYVEKLLHLYEEVIRTY